MPTIVIGADTDLGVAIANALLGESPEVRAFVTDPEAAGALKAMHAKVAVGDVSDTWHVVAAATNTFCAVVMAEAAVDVRDRAFADDEKAVVETWAIAIAIAIAEAGPVRAIWVGEELPGMGQVEAAVSDFSAVPTRGRPHQDVVSDVLVRSPRPVPVRAAPSQHAQGPHQVPLAPGHGSDHRQRTVTAGGHLDQTADDPVCGIRLELRLRPAEAGRQVVGVDDYLDQPRGEVLVEQHRPSSEHDDGTAGLLAGKDVGQALSRLVHRCEYCSRAGAGLVGGPAPNGAVGVGLQIVSQSGNRKEIAGCVVHLAHQLLLGRADRRLEVCANQRDRPSRVPGKRPGGHAFERTVLVPARPGSLDEDAQRGNRSEELASGRHRATLPGAGPHRLCAE